MTDTFASLGDLRSYLETTRAELALALDDPGLRKAVEIRDHDGPHGRHLTYGYQAAVHRANEDLVAIVGPSGPQSVSVSFTRAAMIRLCVEAARHRLRTRVIRRWTFLDRNPLWSCHADLVVVAGLVNSGLRPASIKMLGPGRSRPEQHLRTIRPEGPFSLVKTFDRTAGLHVEQHTVKDGKVSIHASNHAVEDDGTLSRRIDLQILSDHRQAINLPGVVLPETALVAMVGRPLRDLVSHSATDRVPDLRICAVSRGETYTFVELEPRAAFLAEPPRGADLSFATLGNDLLASIGERPSVVLPYDPGMHLAPLARRS